jgi:hypothetical protein
MQSSSGSARSQSPQASRTLIDTPLWTRSSSCWSASCAWFRYSTRPICARALLPMRYGRSLAKRILHPFPLTRTVFGAGAYSHWQGYLYFSASDGSDPRANGRTYTVSSETWLHSIPTALLIPLSSLLLDGSSSGQASRRLIAEELIDDGSQSCSCCSRTRRG